MAFPKAGDVVKDRTVIRVIPAADIILFGQREGEVPNCGAYRTDLEEWLLYSRGKKD
jgi:hypothetical protein